VNGLVAFNTKSIDHCGSETMLKQSTYGDVSNLVGSRFAGGTSQIIENEAIKGYGNGIYSGSSSVT
jgi:hypothetical protein